MTDTPKALSAEEIEFYRKYAHTKIFGGDGRFPEGVSTNALCDMALASLATPGLVKQIQYVDGVAMGEQYTTAALSPRSDADTAGGAPIHPSLQMAMGNHSIGVFDETGKLLAADTDIYVAPQPSAVGEQAKRLLERDRLPLSALYANGERIDLYEWARTILDLARRLEETKKELDEWDYPYWSKQIEAIDAALGRKPNTIYRSQRANEIKQLRERAEELQRRLEEARKADSELRKYLGSHDFDSRPLQCYVDDRIDRAIEVALEEAAKACAFKVDERAVKLLDREAIRKKADNE